MIEEASAAAGVIAVIGLSCRFPGADTPERFWKNLQSGTESITRFSKEELTQSGIPESVWGQPGYVPVKGAIDQADGFDAGFFGLSAREGAIMDPQQRVFLECAWSALEDAGYTAQNYPGAIGVFAGSILSMYLLRHVWPNRELVEGTGAFQAALGNDSNFLATRVAYHLGLRGVSISVGTACSTSLIAVHLACQSLLLRETDMVLAGGVSIHLPLVNGYLFETGSILSPDGHCRPFDADAQGTVSGDGAGVVVLKRLEDALEDGDHIYAVIRGSAANNDGAAKVGFTAPGVTGQARVIAEALAVSGLEPTDMAFIETHGAGTVLGDPIEVAALREAFGDCDGRRAFCALGSVKSNVGHLDSAAGVAGLMKAVLTLHHREMPPMLNFRRPNPATHMEDGPFYVNSESIHFSQERTLRGGVSSFGIGGTNVHVVLEEAPQFLREGDTGGRMPQLLPVSAQSEEALNVALAQLGNHLSSHAVLDLADVAYTLQIGRKPFQQRAAVVAYDTVEAGRLLSHGDAQRLFRGTVSAKPELVFMFPGLGDHYPGMGWELYCTQPAFRESVDRSASLLQPVLKADIRSALYPGKDYSHPHYEPTASKQPSKPDLRAMLGRGAAPAESPGERPAFLQTGIFVTEAALADLLLSWGLVPAACIGHSIGEFAAAYVSGVFSLDDALRTVATRALLIEDHALPGLMLAVPLQESEAAQYVSEEVSLAAVNGSNVSVLSGSEAGIAETETRLKQRGVSFQRLRSAYAYHSMMMQPVAKLLEQAMSGVKLSRGRIPYISCTTGTWIRDEQAVDPRYWSQHLCHTVRFYDGLRELMKESSRLLVEVGPGQGLTSQAVREQAQFAQGRPAVVPLMRWHYSSESELAALLNGLARLWVAGAPLDWTALTAAHPARRVPLPTYPFQHQRLWIEPPANPALSDGRAEQVRKPLHDWFYLRGWKPSLAPLVPDVTALKKWLILSDATGVGARLAERLRFNQADVRTVALGNERCGRDEDYTVDPSSPESLSALFARLQAEDFVPQRIVHLWSLMPAEPDCAPSSECFWRLYPSGYGGLVATLQALLRSGRDHPERLDIVSNHLFQVTRKDNVSPEKALLRGPALVAPQEHANFFCRVTDIDVSADNVREAAAQLYNELLCDDEATAVAYRDGDRLVESWTQVSIPMPGDHDLPLRRQGIYLITGGLGSVGLAIAEYLTEKVAARLVLLGRSKFPERSAWSDWQKTRPEEDPTSRTIRKLQALEARGVEVLIVQADVSSEPAMREAFARAEARFGGVHGVIHAAGSVGIDTFSEIVHMRPEHSEEQLRAKVFGVMTLQRILETRTVDFCMLTSSLSALLGGIGFTAYSAANLYLDSFAAWANRRRTGNGIGPRWLSIDWDSWRLEDAGAGNNLLGGTVSAYYVHGHEGAEAFVRVLAQPALTQVAVSSGSLDERLRQWVGQRKVLSASVVSLQERPTLASNYEAPRNELERQLAAIWQNLFGVSPIGVHDNFFALGGHSLLATQLNARLYAMLRVEIPLVSLLRAPTVAELAGVICALQAEHIDAGMLEDLLADIESMSAEELEAVLTETAESTSSAEGL
ncbi:type I polyketide synthase [Granulicella mallensis]|uniref:Acyl transferase domain-containing protein n=1 Tax=Granulicella mallensis TaxID=940614 RepID=A0A7W8E8G5_9BACT|nr:type I polyketide synthase [Granulicella mallensis]MBB5062611.1 acyl transferase domain-containing protein [Granulicella mallensis]